MALTQPPSLHQAPELWCQFCGRREPLPADAADRHRHLRLRLLQLARAREASDAPLRSLKAMGDVWPIAIAVSAGMGLIQSWNFVRSWQAVGNVEPSQAVLGALPLAVAFGMLCGWLGMRHVFSRQLRPLLRARPAQQAGLAVRCRNCGGNLPAVRAPELICTFCGATNLLDAALTANAAELLAAERREYEQRLLPWARDPRVYLAPSRAFYRYGAVGGGAALALFGFALFVILR
jgi:hypothetical protein